MLRTPISRLRAPRSYTFCRQPNRTIWSWRRAKPSVPTIYQPRTDPWFSPIFLLIGLVPVLTFSLGTWQLNRLKWKVNLIDELQEKLELPALSLPKRIKCASYSILFMLNSEVSFSLDVIPEFAFRKVVVRGKWDHEHEMVVGPRPQEDVHGSHVITPLIREDGSTVLVDRGFVSKDIAAENSFTRELGEVEVLGLLRTTPARNAFTPTNDPERGIWYWNDIPAMAEYAGGSKAGVQPVFVERIFGTNPPRSLSCTKLTARVEGHAGEANQRIEKGIPVGRPATVDLRNAHLSYVITW